MKVEVDLEDKTLLQLCAEMSDQAWVEFILKVTDLRKELAGKKESKDVERGAI